MSQLRNGVALAKAVAQVSARRFRRGPRHPRWSLPFEVGVELCGRALDEGPASVRAGRVPPGRTAEVVIPPPLRGRLDHAHGELAGLPVEIHTPRVPAPEERTLMYIHGGGYFTCSPATHRALAARLAVASGARTVLPNYRKAPEHPFPAAIDDVERAYMALLAEGVDPASLFVGGDSAGGGLVLALVQRLRAARAALPRGLVLLSPLVDLSAEQNGSMLSNRYYDYLPTDRNQEIVDGYLSGADPKDPLASPVEADLAGFPPMLVLTGSLEVFLDQNRALCERATACGAEVTHVIADDMVHVYPLLADVSPRARADIRRVAQFIRGGLN